MMFTGKTIFYWAGSVHHPGPVVAMGREASSAARKMIGATNPLTAEPGTIRGDFGTVLVVTSSTAQMPLKPLVMKLALV